MSFTTLTTEDICALTEICEAVSGEQAGEDYTHDEMPVYGSFQPELVLFPTETEQISRVMSYCNGRNLPVTVRGAGTGLCGGAVPVFGGVLLCTEKMNRIIEVDAENLCATVEPGVLLMDFTEHVLQQGLFYPPEPGEKSATLGGNVSTNAGGMKAVKYGVTRNYVLGLEAVLPDGRVIEVGGKLAKNSSGYNMLNLLVGSEGTLAVLTKLTLRLIPKPGKMISLLVPFESLDACIEAVPLILRSNLSPTAIEFMQQDIILASDHYLGHAFPDKSANAYLLLTFDGTTRLDAEALCDHAAQVCIGAGARDAFYADTGERFNSLWTARGAFLEAIKSSTQELDECDVVVPRNQIARFIARINELGRQNEARITYFGHAGDGNIHIYVCRDDQTEDVWKDVLERSMQAMYDIAIEFGGKVSGEHGIGHAKIDFLHESEGAAIIELMSGIKNVFDPKGILNPGKVL